MLEGAADALALGFAQLAGQQQQAAAALGALFQQVEGLAHGEVGALAGLGHDRRFQGVEQVARGELVVRQRHQGMRAAGVDDDRGLRVVARAKQVEQLAPGLLQAGRDRSPASIPGVSWRIATSGSLRFIEGCSSCCQLGPSKASRASSQAMPRQIQGMRFCRPARRPAARAGRPSATAIASVRHDAGDAAASTATSQAAAPAAASRGAASAARRPATGSWLPPGTAARPGPVFPWPEFSATSSTLRPRAAASGQLYSARAGAPG